MLSRAREESNASRSTSHRSRVDNIDVREELFLES
jgi:hypothetical protein